MKWINYMEPNYDNHEIDAVNDYMKSGAWLTEFSKTREFEDMIKSYTGAKYCSVMMNGTVTLIAALMACGIKVGDEVIVPDFTMSATSHAVEIIGAKAVFVDIERSTLCMDFEQMKKAINKKTKAVIFVNMNGRYSSHFLEMIEYCRKNKIWIIEDAAQALGSSFRGVSLGTFADIGSYSFSMPKIITTGQGGAVVTNNKELYEKMIRIRDFGREKAGSDHYLEIGANFKFTDIQAVIGIEQMKKLQNRVYRKKEIAKLYDSYLADVDEIELIKNNYDDTAPCFIEILCKGDKYSLIEYLKEKGIGSRPFYPALHAEPAYGQNDLSFPVSEEISKMGMWLPSSSKLTNQEVEYICNTIKDFYRK